MSCIIIHAYTWLRKQKVGHRQAIRSLFAHIVQVFVDYCCDYPYNDFRWQADMAELADAHGSGPCENTHGGSSPLIRTIDTPDIHLDAGSVALYVAYPLFKQVQFLHMLPCDRVPPRRRRCLYAL